MASRFGVRPAVPSRPAPALLAALRAALALAGCTILALAGCTILALAGCAMLGGGGGSEAARQLARARAAAEAHDLDTAWDELEALRIAHPTSAEAREGFPLAAAIFKAHWRHDRFDHPESRWITEAPAFLFAWLATYLDTAPDAGASPEAEAQALFLGMPYGLSRDFDAFLAARPTPPRWQLAVQEDNGRIESVRAAPAVPRAATPAS